MGSVITMRMGGVNDVDNLKGKIKYIIHNNRKKINMEPIYTKNIRPIPVGTTSAEGVEGN